MTPIDFISQLKTPLTVQTAMYTVTPDIEVEKGLFAIAAVVLIPILIVLFFIIRFIYRHTIGKKLKTTLIEDYKKEADGYEKVGRFVSAASVHEKRLKDYEKAATLYEKGKDYQQAALLYNQLGMSQKAKEMYVKDRNIDRAAEIAIREGDYAEAARLYDSVGKKVETAMALEKAGRKLAAVKAYREAREYRKASTLLEEEGMLKEASEMFGLSLLEQKPDSSNIDDFYTYATMLEKTGDTQKSLEVFREIDSAEPTFRDVKERIHRLIPSSKSVI